MLSKIKCFSLQAKFALSQNQNYLNTAFRDLVWTVSKMQGESKSFFTVSILYVGDIASEASTLQTFSPGLLGILKRLGEQSLSFPDPFP